MDIGQLRRLENKLYNVRGIKLLKYITPLNLGEQKELFLRNDIDEPKFKYHKPEHDFENAEHRLRKIIDEIPNEGLGRLLVEKGEELLLYNQIVNNVGNAQVVKKLSARLFGKVEKELLDQANKWLENIPKKGEPKRALSAGIVAKRIEEYLTELNLSGWEVKVQSTASVAVNTLKRKVIVSDLKRYSQNDIKRLLVHEIDVHALRAENGHQQPLKIFARGLAGFMSTGDGIALYLEKKRNVMDNQREKEIALRVIAADMVYQDKDYRTVFDQLKKYEKDKDKCWEIAYRVFRGGGFIKDHLYLLGYFEVKGFVERGGDLKELFVGRVGLHNLNIIRQLVNENVLQTPAMLPDYI